MKWKQDLDLPSGEREERKLQVQPVRGKTSQINLGVTITEKIEFSQVAGGDFSSCVPESLRSLLIQSRSWAGSNPSHALLRRRKALEKPPGNAAGALWHSWTRLLLQCPAELGAWQRHSAAILGFWDGAAAAQRRYFGILGWRKLQQRGYFGILG